MNDDCRKQEESLYADWARQNKADAEYVLSVLKQTADLPRAELRLTGLIAALAFEVDCHEARADGSLF